MKINVETVKLPWFVLTWYLPITHGILLKGKFILFLISF